MTLRSRWTAPGGAAVLWAALVSPAVACGDLQDWVAKYTAPSANDPTRLTALAEIAGPCSGYVARRSDGVLLSLLADAVARRFPPGTVQRVFDAYRCLPGARNDAAYASVARRLDVSRCPTAADLDRWRVVAVASAHLRAGPGRTHGRVGALFGGTVVSEVGRVGHWAEVVTWRGVRGFVHVRLLKPY